MEPANNPCSTVKKTCCASLPILLKTMTGVAGVSLAIGCTSRLMGVKLTSIALTTTVISLIMLKLNSERNRKHIKTCASGPEIAYKDCILNPTKEGFNFIEFEKFVIKEIKKKAHPHGVHEAQHSGAYGVHKDSRAYGASLIAAELIILMQNPRDSQGNTIKTYRDFILALNEKIKEKNQITVKIDKNFFAHVNYRPTKTGLQEVHRKVRDVTNAPQYKKLRKLFEKGLWSAKQKKKMTLINFKPAELKEWEKVILSLLNNNTIGATIQSHVLKTPVTPQTLPQQDFPLPIRHV